MGEYRKVAKMANLEQGSGTSVQVGDKRIALFRVGGEVHAVDDACTHRGGPLSEGTVEGSEVTCPWHGARFNVKTGEALCPPAPGGVTRYPVRVSGDDVEIEI